VIVEHRTYTIKALHTGAFLKLYESAALPLQIKYLGHLIGFYVSEIGPLNEVVHLWGFASLAERERRRALMEADPGWAVYRQALLELDVVVDQNTKILRSTSFSPTVNLPSQP
jgi:hypothetical protein